MKIVFEITDYEVRKVAGRKLNHKQIKEILTAVENDSVLWNEIEKSIRDAMEQFAN